MLLVLSVFFSVFIVTVSNVFTYEGAKKEENIYRDPVPHRIEDIVYKYNLRLPYSLFAALLASLPFLRKAERKYLFLFCAMMFFWILSLGNYLSLPSILSGLGINSMNMPFYYLRKILPGLSRLRGPEIIVFYVYIIAGVYLARAVEMLIHEFMLSGFRIVIYVLVIFAVVAELMVYSEDYPVKSLEFRVPAIYDTIRKSGSAIIYLPLFLGVKSEIIYQIWHKQPIAEYALGIEREEFIDRDYFEYFRNNIFLQNLLLLSYDVDLEKLAGEQNRRHIEELKKIGVGYLIYSRKDALVIRGFLETFANRDYLNSIQVADIEGLSEYFQHIIDSRHEKFLRSLSIFPIYTDENIILFRL